jgi:hypothetical protein
VAGRQQQPGHQRQNECGDVAGMEHFRISEGLALPSRRITDSAQEQGLPGRIRNPPGLSLGPPGAPGEESQHARGGQSGQARDEQDDGMVA